MVAEAVGERKNLDSGAATCGITLMPGFSGSLLPRINRIYRLALTERRQHVLI